MLDRRHACAVMLAVVALSAGVASGVQVQGTIVHVGFPGSTSDSGQTQGLDRYRVGSWVPIAVELINMGGDQTELTLEARQQDQDGDEVLARRTVWPQGKQRYFLYVPAGKEQAPQYFTIRVYDSKGQYARLVGSNGEDITELKPPPILQPISSDYQVILDISQKPLAPLRNLTKEDQKLVRPLVVLRGVDKDLPDDVAGLDMADMIVWDAADPSRMDLEPRNALIEWVRRGGTLVLGVSKTWDLVGKGKFGEILPAMPTQMAAMSQPPEYLKELLSIEAFDSAGFKPELSYCPITSKDLAGGAQVLVPGPLTAGERTEVTTAQEEGAFVTRRPYGRGQVILVAAELSDLLSRGSRPGERVLADLIGVRILKTDSPDRSSINIKADVFDTLRRKTTFGVTAGLYLGFAFLFVVAYILMATGGTWAWLKRQQKVQHTWTVFAMVSIAASVVSVASVQWMRGVRYRVQELTIVDSEAGSNQGHAACYFGLKAPIHSKLDLRVPRNWNDPGNPTDMPGLLAPLAPTEREDTVFASRERYQAVAGLGELQGVPLRATLKQFEAEWEGQLPGRLEAGLRRDQVGTVKLNTDSWIRNGLGTELRSCYLFVAGSDVPRARVTRDLQIRVYGLPLLPADKRVTLNDFKDLGVLQTNQSGWLRNLGVQLTPVNPYGRTSDEQQNKEITQEGFEAALLLMSLYDEVDQSEPHKSGFELLRSRGHDLDRSAYLRQNTALFVGFSRDAGPARLCYRDAGTKQKWSPLKPIQADVVYRMAIPVVEPGG